MIPHIRDSAETIHKVALNSLSAHVAILDNEGVILETNAAWRHHAAVNGLQGNFDCIGVDYLKVCDLAGNNNDADALKVSGGIRDVLAGRRVGFFFQYPCHTPTKKQWFALRVVPFDGPGKARLVVSHEDITPIMLIQEALEKKEKDLQQKTLLLEETNAALKVMLRHRDQDKQAMEDAVLTNVRELVMPYLDRLSEVPLKERERNLVAIIQSQLKDIISPFLNRLSALHKLLTPQQIQVANLVREGRTNKEIASILQISVSAAEFHRKTLRKKLGLTHTGTNLRSFLLSLR